jgi:transposase InsO family protein
VQIERVNHVWSAAITSIRFQHGFLYWVAVIDWWRRYVRSWAVAITLDGALCLEALETALRGGRPEIFNTDQGAQFTSRAFTERLSHGGIQISMDGRGRALDNVFVERLWRTVKYEEVYLREYRTVREAQQGLGRYFGFYNDERLHQALGYRTPTAIYRGVGQHCPSNGMEGGEAHTTIESSENNNLAMRLSHLTYFDRKLVLTMGSTSPIVCVFKLSGGVLNVEIHCS